VDQGRRELRAEQAQEIRSRATQGVLERVIVWRLGVSKGTICRTLMAGSARRSPSGKCVAAAWPRAMPGDRAGRAQRPQSWMSTPRSGGGSNTRRPAARTSAAV